MVWKQSEAGAILAGEEEDQIMTDEEIRRSYRTAKYPEEQIQILAELTDRSTDDIEAILAGASGDSLPKKRNVVGRWQNSEVAYLKQAYKEGTNAHTIAKHLGRTLPSVRFAIKHHNLRRAEA